MAALVGALWAAAPLDANVAQARGGRRADTLGVGEIRRGMKGYGLTVFEGTKPERFGVEVIDVIQNYFPAQALILIKTEHPRLDVVKNVAGMSGSPIFINGKMIGAYAYGWPFGSEPVAGVTPIENMIDDIERPLPREIFGWPLSPLGKPASRQRPPRVSRPHTSATSYSGAPGEYTLGRHVEQLAARRPQLPSSGGIRPLATPVLIGGLSAGARRMAGDLLAPLGLQPFDAGGGSADVEPGAPEHFEAGGAIGVQLVRGDVNVTPFGTVTRVEGDRLVAFGHPLMDAGVTALPTAVGRVLWILASEESSQKMGVAVRPLGALLNDRQSSIVVSESASAPMVKVRLHVDGVQGAPKSDWQFEIAQEPFMTPSLLAMALGSALQAVAAERQDVTWRAQSRVDIERYGSVELEDFGVSVGGTPDPRQLEGTEVVTAVGSLLNNPWEVAAVRSIDTTITLSYARELVQLRGVRALETEIDAGQPAHIELTLVPFAGPEYRRVLTVPLPRHLAGSRVKLSIRPGHAVERERATPESLTDFVGNLAQPNYPPRSIIVSFASGAGAAFRGRVATDLPPGALDRIRQETSSFSPEAFRSEQRQVIELPVLVVGEDSVSVTIRPPLR
jgi:SpoIVB peptidase S55